MALIQGHAEEVEIGCSCFSAVAPDYPQCTQPALQQFFLRGTDFEMALLPWRHSLINSPSKNGLAILQANTWLEPSCHIIPRSGLTQPLPWISLINLQSSVFSRTSFRINCFSFLYTFPVLFQLAISHFPRIPFRKVYVKMKLSVERNSRASIFFPCKHTTVIHLYYSEVYWGCCYSVFHYIWWVYPCMFIECHCKMTDFTIFSCHSAFNCWELLLSSSIG